MQRLMRSTMIGLVVLFERYVNASDGLATSLQVPNRAYDVRKPSPDAAREEHQPHC
jgi:hypothetical protein